MRLSEWRTILARDTLKFVRDIERCIEENRVGIVEAKTDVGMSDK